MAYIRKAAYFKGERLHQNLQLWRIAPTANLGRLQGAYRLMGFANPRSRNWYTELTVVTAVRPAAGVAGMDPQTQLNAALLQKHDSLLAVSDTLGPVSWCEDDSQESDVSSVHAADPSPVPVSIGALGGGWVPTVGQYLLCRKPSSDQQPSPGFVALIEAVAPGLLTFIVQQDIDATWEVTAIQQHYPEMAYESWADGGGTSPATDFLRTGPVVAWRFVGGEDSRIVLAQTLQQDLS